MPEYWIRRGTSGMRKGGQMLLQKYQKPYEVRFLVGGHFLAVIMRPLFILHDKTGKTRFAFTRATLLVSKAWADPWLLPFANTKDVKLDRLHCQLCSQRNHHCKTLFFIPAAVPAVPARATRRTILAKTRAFGTKNFWKKAPGANQECVSRHKRISVKLD